jgi:choline dehydrogenase
VGAGSAGCVVVNRLVNGGKRVLVLEAGPKDDDKFVHIPATLIRVVGTERTWLYETVPQSHVAGRTMYVPQGRTLGGGSSVNGMIYIRGQPQDYDEWREMGCVGWGWEDVLPVFRRSEANMRLSGPFHGVDGPLTVSDARYHHPLSRAFIEAAHQSGLPYNDDFNGESQNGVGFYQTTTAKGRRRSTAVAYLRPVLAKNNLTVITGALATRVMLENGAAVGVSYLTSEGEVKASARAEVILSAGTLATPKLLMLSGIGPANELKSYGISVMRDLPGVGRNLQDHLGVPVYARLNRPLSMLGEDKGLKLLRHGLSYIVFRKGLLASTVIEAGAFVDTRRSGRPDIQFHVLPVFYGDVDRPAPDGHGMSIEPCFLRPKSRGVVRLRSSNPSDSVVFDPNFLSDPGDLEAAVRGVRLARTILRAPSLAKLVEEEVAPRAGDSLSDQELEDHVRRYARTVYHPVGTCRMGMGADAVVDPTLRVRGVNRLRVADASVMPKLISGNTNAASIMIGERCADFLLTMHP